MKHPVILCCLGIISALSMNNFARADTAKGKSFSNAPCYSKDMQGRRTKRVQDDRISTAAAIADASGIDAGQSGNRNQVVKCDMADQRMELLILVLQIMRGPK